MKNDPKCICCDPGERCRGFCTTGLVFSAAEALNKANVRDARNVGMRNGLYRDNMSAEARKLDEAFQHYYESSQPRTDRMEFPASVIGFTLKQKQEPIEPPKGGGLKFD